MFSGVAWGGSGVLRDYSGALMRFRGFRGFSGVVQGFFRKIQGILRDTIQGFSGD